MRKGDVWWANLPEPSGRRPVLLLSRDASIPLRTNVIVAEITMTIRHIPTEVLLHASEGMPRDCAVNLDVINTIPKSCFDKKIMELGTQKIQRVEKALKYALALT